MGSEVKEDPLTLDVIEWIQSNAIRLSTVEPNDDFSDLVNLKQILSGVDAIGLGEATHGTREFFQLKHLMLRYLSTELGFDTLAFETPFVGDINTSIRNPNVELVNAFREQTFAVWQTEEILEMVAWMRTRNLQIPAQGVDFVGIDCQLDRALIHKSIEVLNKLGCATAHAEKLREAWNGFLEQKDSKERTSGPRLFRAVSLTEQISFMRGFAEASRLPPSIAEHLTVLEPALQLHMVSNEHLTYSNLRDKFMAENVLHLIDQGRKPAVWAHNGHVSCLKNHRRQTMGHHLRETLGSRYYPIAFSFFKGEFRSNFKSRKRSSEYCVAMPPLENLEHILLRTGVPMFFLDLRAAKLDRNFERWWSIPRKIQGTGARHNTETGQLGSYAFSSQEYDGIIFLEQTNSSRLLSAT